MLALTKYGFINQCKISPNPISLSSTGTESINKRSRLFSNLRSSCLSLTRIFGFQVHTFGPNHAHHLLVDSFAVL